VARVWNGEARKTWLYRSAGHMLLRAAVLLEARHQSALLTTFPPASESGEYPHVRTGNLWQSVTHEPKQFSPREAHPAVAVFYDPNLAPYGDILTAHGRLGIGETMNRHRSEISSRLGAFEDVSEV
jgi:hypothetical protein